MLNKLRNGLISVQEVYSVCSQRIVRTQVLNAFVKLTGDVSRSQAEESSHRYDKGTTAFNILPGFSYDIS